MIHENNSKDPIDILVECSMQDLLILDILSDEDIGENDNNGENNNINDDGSDATFGDDDLCEWLEDDDESCNRGFSSDDLEPINIITSYPKKIEQSRNNLASGAVTISKDTRQQHPFRTKLVESLKKLESSMRRTEMSRRQILCHKNQTINTMSIIKCHKRKSLIVESNQTRKRLSDFAPHVTSSLTHKNDRKRTSLTHELENSRKRLNSLLCSPSRQSVNAVTA